MAGLLGCATGSDVTNGGVGGSGAGSGSSTPTSTTGSTSVSSTSATGAGNVGSNSSAATAGSGGSAASSTTSTTETGVGPGPASTVTSAGAGGATVASSSSSGGSAAGGAAGACPGIPIVPDAGGSVAVGSNSVAIHGSWFVYSDCTDLKNKNCAMVTTPPANMFPNTGGKMCTSGQTSTATGAWGAGIALELNDGPPQMPYDTVAHNIKGFCFQLSGATIPSTTIRVAFPTKNNQDNAYFVPVSTPGQQTVLFADAAQGSWVTTKSAFEPTMVMLMQFQIPSSTTAPVPWDFCIEGLTAITD
jgi:hypothetical protein